MRGNSDRFYIKEGLGSDLLCIKDKELIRQWRKVMRLGEGDVVRLFDGSGYEYQYSICNTQYANKAQLKLIDKQYFEEKENKVFLGFGVLHDQARMEWMLEKCTELGVDRFIPLVCDNSQLYMRNSKLKIQSSKPQLKTSKLKKQERLEKKIVEACEQCGRVRVPGIETIWSINDIDDVVGADPSVRPRVIVLDKLKIRNEKLKIDIYKNILLLVGPEGGWSERELKYFAENNLEFMSVGENVLRAETAAVAGVVRQEIRNK